MQKTALITGILGQDGPYLTKLLLEKGYHVYGMIRNNPYADFSNTDYLNVTDDIEFVEGDMTDESSLIKLIKSIKPTEIYNLAAQSFVAVSWEQSRLTTEVNSLGVLYLLNAIKDFSPSSRFYQASTSELFGKSNDNGIQTEETALHPKSPYAISKLYSFWMVNNFRESYRLFCANGILFNHESPIRGEEFVTRKISIGVAKISLGLQDEIRLGNLESQRDWGFAGDYVKAMWLILQQEKAENFIISTGETHSIRDFLDLAFARVGISDWSSKITIDPKFMRPAELHCLKGRSDKARNVLGWEPEVSFEKLVEMMVDADIARLKKKNG